MIYPRKFANVNCFPRLTFKSDCTTAQTFSYGTDLILFLLPTRWGALIVKSTTSSMYKRR